jgi:citronellol/citronellal dehydrogenase
MNKDLTGKTAFITGASRGIGKHIALKLAEHGANVAIAAKTVEPHSVLKGTIYSAAEEVIAAGGEALPLMVNIMQEEMVKEAVEKTVDTFGGIDILINNASAINLTDTLNTPMRRFDLMHNVNVRGTFMVSKYCIPHLKKAENPHILVLSPPLNMDPKWFKGFLAYTMSKYGMSMCVLGFSEEYRDDGIAVNALWPKTIIATAAIRYLFGGNKGIEMSRHPGILADAALEILTRNSKECTGNFFLDEEVLEEIGIKDFAKYAINPDLDLMPDLFVD